MELLSLKVLKEKRLRKNNRKSEQTKKIVYSLTLELKEILSEHLEENDGLLIEINDKYVGEFILTLNDRLLSMYDYEQADRNKFIFYNKEIAI